VLAYQGDPETGARLTPPPGDLDFLSVHHIWDLDHVLTVIADKSHDRAFFCGSSRNWHKFIHLMNVVFLLELDRQTLERRIDTRVDEWGSEPAERAIIMALHANRKQQPEQGIRIDAARPLTEVVDTIIAH